MTRCARFALWLLRKARCSVRTLLALVLLVALAMGGLIVPYLGYRRQIDSFESRFIVNLTTRPCWQARLVGDAKTGPIVAADFSSMDDAGLALVGGCAELEELEIGEFHGCATNKELFTPTDAGLVHLGSLSKLRRLDLGGDWLTDEGLKHLGKLSHLEELSLGRASTRVDDDDEHPEATGAVLDCLKPLGKLRILSLNSGWYTGETLRHVSQLGQVEELHLNSYHAREGNHGSRDAGLAYLRSLGRLRRLTLDVSWMTDEDFAPIGMLDQLEDLSIRQETDYREGRILTDAGLTALGSLGKLRRLAISASQLTDGTIDHVRKLHQLEELTLILAGITDEGLHRLAGLDRLRVLELAYTELEGGGLDFLQEVPDLRELILRSNGSLDDHAVAHLAGVTQIRKLVIDGVEGRDLATLASMTHLETLEIEPLTVDSIAKKQLHDLKSSLPRTRVMVPEPSMVYSSGFR